ncbi:peptidyl-tRNA hydrolase [Pelomyxa schiedti]|nr:peptidyl-tRNA hydrolase [Pelomyxa schiedti]
MVMNFLCWASIVSVVFVVGYLFGWCRGSNLPLLFILRVACGRLLIRLRMMATMRGGSQMPKDSEMTDEVKLVLCVRSDLKMGVGKVAAQCCHAAAAVSKKGCEYDAAWALAGGKKVVVKIGSEEEMIALQTAAIKAKLLTYVVRDAGRTQVDPLSRTVLSIGPAPSSLLDPITKHLKLI